MIKKYNLILDKDSNIPCLKETRYSCRNIRADCPDKAVEILNDAFDFDRMAEEVIYLLGCDSKSKVLGVFLVSHGGINSAMISPREVMIRMLLIGAVGFIVLHNHPSGEIEPSQEDRMISKRLKEAGNLIGISMLDFIIVGRNTFYSESLDRTWT